MLQSPPARRRLRAAAFAALFVAAVLVQSTSLHNFSGDRTDESEVVHFAVGFFGGDYDPHWYNYGSLNMYVVHAGLRVVQFLSWITGHDADALTFTGRLFDQPWVFYATARMLYAAMGIGAIALLAWGARRLKVSAWLIVPWCAALVVAGTNLHFANYVRTDQLVALGVVTVAMAPLATRPRVQLALATVGAAVAVSAKVSALPILAMPVALWWWRCRHDEDRWRVLAATLAGLIALAWVFQPYLNPVELLQRQFDRRIAGSPFRFGSTLTIGWGGRLARSATHLLDWVGALSILASVGVLLGRARLLQHALWALASGLAVTAPFLLSPDIRYYWLRPLHFVLWWLALLGLHAMVERLSDTRRPAARVVVAVAVVALSLGSIAPLLRSWSPGTTNDEVATAWLEARRDEGERLVLAAPYLQHLPEVYDASQPDDAKRISRAFIFNRWYHPFMNLTFVRWLTSDYAAGEPIASRPVHAVRIDIAAEAGQRVDAPHLSVCDADGGDCSPVEVARAPGADEDGNGTLVADGPVVSVVFDLEDTPGDASRTLAVEIRDDHLLPGEDTAQVFYDTRGTGFSSEGKSRVYAGRSLLPLWFPEARGLVETVTPLDMDEPEADETLRSLTGALFVVSPSIYNRFIGVDPNSVPEDARESLLVNQEWYEGILQMPLVERFDDGAGPIVEVYRIGE